MKKSKCEKMCRMCEYSQKICSGDYYMCSKKGAVAPDFHCRRFSFDPLKIEVSVTKIPEFVPMLK